MKKTPALVGVYVAALGLLLMGAAPASATSHCKGTLGCFTYIKLRYKAELIPWAKAVPSVNATNEWQDAGVFRVNDDGSVVYTPSKSKLRKPFGATNCGELRIVLSVGDIRRPETTSFSRAHVCPFA